MKDVPHFLVNSLPLMCFLARRDNRDIVVGIGFKGFPIKTQYQPRVVYVASLCITGQSIYILRRQYNSFMASEAFCTIAKKPVASSRVLTAFLASVYKHPRNFNGQSVGVRNFELWRRLRVSVKMRTIFGGLCNLKRLPCGV